MLIPLPLGRSLVYDEGRLIVVEAYQGYFVNERFVPYDNVVIPEDREVIVTVLDKPAQESRIDRQLRALEEFQNGLRDCDEELGPEFDEIISRRVNITRELDL
jgi:hypothetical protein